MASAILFTVVDFIHRHWDLGKSPGCAPPSPSRVRTLFQMEGSWYLPPSLFSEGLSFLILMASFTPRSKYLGSTHKMLVSLRETLCPLLSVCRWRDTSDPTELGQRCSRNLVFNACSVSPTYEASKGPTFYV